MIDAILLACGLNLHVAAYHPEPGYEWATPGLGVVCETPVQDLSVIAGAYSNSMARRSVYAGVMYQPFTVGPFKVGGALGLIDYPKEFLVDITREGKVFDRRTRVLPLVAGVVSYKVNRHLRLHMQVVPKIKESPLAVGVSVEVRY